VTTSLACRRARLWLAAALLTASCGSVAERPEQTLVFKHGKVPGEHRLLRELLDRFEAETGTRVVDETLPASSDVQHQYFITTLEGGASGLDVLAMDVIWVPEFSRAGWLLDLSDRVDAELRADLFPAPLEACTHEGRLYGVPWYIDAGVLYYRRDLLEKHGRRVPQTYPELAETARTILAAESRPDLYGFLWQGKQYEGLVCVSLEILSSFGAEVLRERQVRFDSGEARAALRFQRSLLTNGASPRLVTTADEEATRQIFGAGKAVFLRNWVYVWNLFQREGSPVKGKVGVMPIPPGETGNGGSTLGGWQLGIARSTRHPEQAWALIEFLVRPENQAYLTRTVGYRPSRRSLYSDPELVRDIPILPILRPILERARPRPVTPLYLALSQTLQSELSAVVAGVKDVDSAVRDAHQEMEFVLRELGDDPGGRKTGS
jgi:multiple sugar transport system substrate-binding protein